MMGSVDKVYILSKDYWSFDTATLDAALNFYTKTWILPKADYENLKAAEQQAYYRCALFYHTNRRDNHGYMPTVISKTTDGVRVMGRNAQAMLEPRTYEKGDETGYSVSDGTNTIVMQSATATKKGKVTVDENVAGKFSIENFYTTNQDINQTINMLENEATQSAEEYSAESNSNGGQNMNAEHDKNKTHIDVDLKEGALTQYGWHADASAKKRKAALMKSVEHEGYEKTMQRLNILHTYWKNNQKGMARKVTNDMNYLRNTYRAEDTMSAENIDDPSPTAPASAPAGSEMVGGDGGAPLVNVDSASAPPEGIFVASAETFEALGEPDAPYDQGYDDQLDESLAMRDGPESSKMQSWKDRRDESKGMERHYGKKPYSSVGTMDLAGEDVNPETMATLPYQSPDYPGMPVVANSFGEGSAIGAGQGVPEWYGSAEHKQGYDDRDDESIGERHRGKHKQSLKDRRDESKGMTGSVDPHHPYADVSTMSAEETFSAQEVMEVVADALDGANLYDSGIYELSNSYGENSGGYWMGGLSTGGGVPTWYGSAEGGDSMNAEEFMTLLAEVVEGIEIREAVMQQKSNKTGKAMAAVLGIGTVLAAAWAIKQTGFDA
tara:strand:+ start:292 stop:2118 length:1827 start_codon:yes stop_codon:yes gene_type:complete